MAEEVKAKKYYDVKIETTIPALLIFRVYANDEQEALLLASRRSPNDIKYFFNKRKDILVKIYDAGTVLLRFIKNL